MFHNVEQNTDEWLDLRAGKLTGSAISKVMANYGKAFGEPAKRYAIDLAITQITGNYSSESYTNEHMERGHDQEPIARMLYENETFCSVSNGGFFDNGFTGDSPDGLVGGDGVLEIKSVISSTHYERWRKEKYDTGYHWQLMFHLRETGRDWVDFVSYCSEFPENKRLFIQRLNRCDFDDDLKKLDSRVVEFKELVENIKKDIEK